MLNLNLEAFYHTPLGQKVQSALMAEIASIWSQTCNTRLLGIGYAQPFLHHFRGECEGLSNFMFAHHGVCSYPPDGPNIVAMVEETLLPVRDNSIDRILCVHALEHSHSSHVFMLEISRVLAPQGECILIVPNRRGVWARVEHTPFGHGQPYTLKQVLNLIESSHLAHIQVTPQLFFPPIRSKFLLKATPFCNFFGKILFAPYAGVFIIRIVKQVFIQALSPEMRLLRRNLTVPSLVLGKPSTA